MHPKTLRLLLIAVLLTAQIATIAFVMLSMQRATTSQFISHAYARVQAMAGALATQARQYLEPAENALVVMQEMLEDDMLGIGDTEALKTHFLLEMRLNASIQGIDLARADGSFVTVFRSGDILLTRTSDRARDGTLTTVLEYDALADFKGRRLEPATLHDPRRQPWYREAATSRSLVWTDPYLLSSTKSPGLSVATKLRAPPGSPDGVIAVHIDVTHLSDFVSDIPNTQGGTAAVVDGAFNTIAWSDATRSLSRQDGPGVLPLSQIAERPMRALKQLVSTPRNTVDEESNGFLRFMVGGEQHVGVSRPFELAGGRVNWTLMVQAPAVEYAGGLHAYFVNWLWTLVGVIIITTLLALWAIMRLTAPVYEMHRNATRDRLTGALSRTEFQRRFANLPRRHSNRAKGLHTVLVAIDFDGFKAVNDRYGHGAGDQVLVEIVDRLKARLRRQDLLARIGGDEFVIAMQLDRSLDAMSAIERLRGSVVATPVATDAGRHTLGITAGIAVRMPDESLHALMTRADHALVSGKASAKNRSYLAEPREIVPSRRAPEVDRTVRRAIPRPDGGMSVKHAERVEHSEAT